MSAPPPKIKAFFSVLKDKYLDVAGDAQHTASDLFEGLVKAELVLRGVLTPDDSKLWQQVQSSIGKPLLEESNLPKPLLAGANVVAGRLAEALATALSESDSKYSVDSSILKRAKDIPDVRWILLLQQEVCFLEIARGYFSRAASIQSETPPMWKKVWDAWTLQSGYDESLAIRTPFEAQLAIQQLVQIAISKGNTKRSAELQVRLLCSYLNPKRISSATARIGKEDILVAQPFGDDLTSMLPTDMGTVAQQAQQVLESCQVDDLSDSEKRLLAVLRVRVGLALEDAKVETMADQQHKSNQNRSVSSSMETCRTNARSKLALEDSDPLLETSLTLRDSVALVWSKGEKEDLFWGPSLETFSQCILRLRERALAKIQKETTQDGGWKIMLEYLLPVLNSFQEQSQWSIEHDRKERMQHVLGWLSSTSDSEENTISLVALSVTKSYWMLLANGNDHSMDITLKYILDLLSALIHHGAPKESQVQEAVGAKSKKNPLSREWKLGRSMMICGIAQTNQAVIDQVSREAVATKKQEEAAVGFLQCMVAWSGWFQRPWSCCSNLSDVRRILAGAQLAGERSLGAVENILLDLARADAELLNGGFPKQSQQLYTRVLDTLNSSTSLFEDSVRAIMRARCYNGLAATYQIFDNENSMTSQIQDLARRAMETLEDLEVPSTTKPLHMWHDPEVFESAITYHRSLARQLIADSLISEGQIEDARSFLEAAVLDAPLDAGAALALGAFLLRVAFYLGADRTPESIKAAQIQLLKAAKMDSSKADPFALLGVWFEESGDEQRALGCFAKSLTLDPCNPVAGRGLLRLKTRENMGGELDTAINSNSPLNGWAWRAIGLNKIFLDAEDEFAVVALLKALRSRDVSAPGNEILGIFYNRPGCDYTNERADALAELAMCYRRLGRFTASIRAFQAAIDAAGENVTSQVLCSCAQVELELSLFDQAADKFGLVLQRQEGSSHAIAAYGQGVALHHIAQRDLEDGKAGSAMKRIQNAIRSCENFSVAFACTRKLLGDLYSFGSLLPPDLFSEDGVILSLERQIEFVRKGESAYRSVIDTQHDDSGMSKAPATCDVASNILLQAQLRQNIALSDPGTNDLYDTARQTFEAALELDPLYAPAWCGLGCSVVAQDPLLAQHAFARCLQIEQMFPDAYANVGFLYTSKKAFGPSESVMNALTQVADTPMMWMNRAFILERCASNLLQAGDNPKAASNLSQASDAYRAAMQVMKHAESQLGLSVTCRVTTTKGGKFTNILDSQMRKDSLSFTKEYNGSSARLHGAVTMLEGIMTLEQAAEADASWKADATSHGDSLISKAKATIDTTKTLNLTSLDAAEKAKTGERDNDDNASGIQFPQPISLQRRILHDPNRADLWLSLSKELLNSSGGGTSAVDAAVAAAARAATMLTDELTNPRQVHGISIPSVKSSQMLSEALALCHWLGSHTSVSEKKEESKDETTPKSEPSPFALQRALMMDPTNAIAREALRLAAVITRQAL